MTRTSVDAAYRKAKVADRQASGGLPEMIDQLAQIPLDFSPGTAWNYSVSIDVRPNWKICQKHIRGRMLDSAFDQLGNVIAAASAAPTAASSGWA
jgi:hypothetical protein